MHHKEVSGDFGAAPCVEIRQLVVGHRVSVFCAKSVRKVFDDSFSAKSTSHDLKTRRPTCNSTDKTRVRTSHYHI